MTTRMGGQHRDEDDFFKQEQTTGFLERMSRQATQQALIANLEYELNHPSRELAPLERARISRELGNAYLGLQGIDSKLKALVYYRNASRDFALMEAEDEKEITRGLLRATIRQVEEEIRGIKEKDLEESERVDIATRPPYEGYWVQRKAWVTSLVIIACMLLLIPVSLLVHTPHFQCVSGRITVNGSTAILPLVQQAASLYQRKCSGATILVNPTPSNSAQITDTGAIGLSQLQSGSATIGTSDIYANPSLSNLVDHQVGIVVFALVINSKVPAIANLDTDQLNDIYDGNATTWFDVIKGSGQEKQLSASDLKTLNNTDIVIVSRPTGSEARVTFEKYILGGPETFPGPPSLMSDVDATVANNICGTTGAVGYVPLYYYYTHKSCLRVISIDNLNPLSVNVVLNPNQNQAYQFWHLEHMYTKGQPHGLAQAFIDFMYSDSVKRYISQYGQFGYLPTSDIAPGVLASH